MDKKKTFTILVVDDAPSIRELITILAKSWHYHVESAENGKHALACLRDGNFDLVITDLQMPEMDGVEFVRAIRSTRAFAHIPVIMFTSHDSITERARAHAAGVNVYMVKGANFKDVLRKNMRELLCQEV